MGDDKAGNLKHFIFIYFFRSEVMGNFRVPLFTLQDGFRGFPQFLTNSFAGSSREQLLIGLRKTGIMTQSEIEVAVKSGFEKMHSELKE